MNTKNEEGIFDDIHDRKKQMNVNLFIIKDKGKDGKKSQKDEETLNEKN